MIKKGLIIFLTFFLFPQVMLAADICLSGWGTAAYNGTGVDTGTLHSAPYYQVDATHIICATGIGGSDRWYLTGSTANCTSGPADYYSDVGPGSNVLMAGGWTVSTGDSPAGVISALACPAPTSTPETSSIINNPNQDLFNGFIIFIIGFFGITWLFKKR
jgi:hypothetical protein